MGLSFKQLDILKVSQDVLDHFDCGHPDFNYFLQNDAVSCAADGEGVTYVLVDDEEKCGRDKCHYGICNNKINSIVL